MKRTALLAATLFILISPALGVVGHNGTGGDMSITSGSSASATTSVGPNGTAYTAKVEMAGRSQNSTEDMITEESISSSNIHFNGTIRANTPCHVIDNEVKETEDGYVLNIKTVKDGLDNSTCVQVISGINYNAEFEAESGFNLEVQHNGETVKEFSTVSDEEEKNQEESSFWSQILSFFGL